MFILSVGLFNLSDESVQLPRRRCSVSNDGTVQFAPSLLFIQSGRGVQFGATYSYLLKIKVNSPELKTIPAIEEVNAYILRSMEEIKSYLQALHEKKEIMGFAQ